MIVVTNRIKTKAGFASKMAPGFTKPGALQSMPGFIKVEVLATQNSSEHDELNVNMYWEDQQYFTQWRNSDAFKAAHAGSNSSAGGESPILGSEIIISEVASVLEASTGE
ncbi:Heme-degrading monooxygenase [compost metagenome]